MQQLLVIEDDKDVRETLVNILELSGYSVASAKNGREGFDAIMELRPELVLCDVDMPEMDGFQLLTTINQRLQGQIIPPFIFLTAKVDNNDVRTGMGLGADDYILKPFEYTDVLDTIRLRLERREKLLANGGKGITANQEKSLDKLAIPSDEGLDLIPFKNIIKCQAERAYCTFYLVNNRKILVSKPMKEFEELLISKGFLKIHKSTIINMDFAEKFVRGKSGHLIMTDGSMVAVSLRKKAELMNLFKSSG